MLILTNKLYNIIPAVYPHACEDGWLFEVNDNETSITCSNPNCPIHGSFKIKNALDVFGMKVNIGEMTALEMVLKLNLKSHMHLFLKAMRSDTNGDTFKEWTEFGKKLLQIQGHIKIMNNSGGVALHKYMEAWSNSTMASTRCQNIFREFDSIKEFYNRFETPSDMQKYIGNRLSVSPYCSTVAEIVTFLLENKENILDVSEVFVFKKAKSGNIRVCITDDILNVRKPDGSSFKPREKFLEYMSDKYNVNITYDKSINRNTNFLINDTGNNLGKARKVRENSLYRNCKIITSDEFETYCQNLTEDAEQKIEVKEW